MGVEVHHRDLHDAVVHAGEQSGGLDVDDGVTLHDLLCTGASFPLCHNEKCFRQLPGPRFFTSNAFGGVAAGNPKFDTPRADIDIDNGGGDMSDSDKIENKADELKGKAKEKVGEATDNEQWQAEGKGEQVKANLKQAAEKVKDAFRG
ncbi:hypothetical protein GCM10022247_50100 [Allokutzneria multivorans]|uniref:CsbD-like domain-containing protein n=2 Tax=Allokutzneria multivorans TaxID=1142134 RepID=A0ABP7T2N0_9PSEU